MNKNYDAGPRVRTNNFFDIGVVGRRTGIMMKTNVKKDADGLDNIDDFWDDDNDNSTADNNQIGTQDADQDEFSGEDDFDEEVHPLPFVQKSDPRRYLEQEAPEELLLTPTSRRSRGGSRGNLSGDKPNYGAEGSPSPSIDRIKKRLVFTMDPSNSETEQTRSHREHTNKASFGSPALDRILRDSQDRKANMTMNASRDSAWPLKGTSIGPTSSTAAINNRAPAKAAPRKAPAKQIAARPSQAPVPSRRPTDLPKAFDFGGYSDDQYDDLGLPNNNMESKRNDANDASDDGRELTPPPPPPPRATAAKAKSVRTVSEFKQKSRVPPAWLAVSDEDEPIHDELETRREDDDRLRFSDEDDPIRSGDDEESEEDEEALQDNRRKMSAFSQKKRTTSIQEPASLYKGAKRAAGAIVTTAKQKYIPKKSASSTTVRQKQRRSDDVDDDEEVKEENEEEEDYGEVPSMTRSKGKSTASSGTSRSSSNNAATKKTGTTRYSGQEVPIVPEQNAEETGVRRSSRTKVAPLKFWMNEKVVYGKSSEGPVIKSVIRAPSEEPQEKRKRMPVKPQRTAEKKEKEKGKEKGKEKVKMKEKQKVEKKNAREDSEESGQEHAPEEDIDDSMDMDEDQAETRKGLHEDPKVTADILVFGSDDVVSQDIAESDSSILFRNVQSGEYQLHRGLEDPGYVVTGTMKIKPNGRKPVNSGTNTSMVFYVIKGLVQVKVHESEFVVSTGGRFLVPRGNTYSILNVSTKESTLFFVQTKQPRPDATETTATASPPAASISITAASSTQPSVKRRSEAGENTAVRAGSDFSERSLLPPPEEKTTTAAAHPRPSSPEPTRPSPNKRRLTSARRLLSTSPSPLLPPQLASSTEETASSNDGAGVNRQLSALAS
ncbi:hypothetical protein BG015_002394 [Linnemannia schmuckeri]|uniref:Mif2/CENP-C cupin domain-containing protein n=1 Tax=Linnemannia schmuckeri TaxID=64567 RepID=A0A9P5RP37_9FUNG|nr:hypothetical protein BG015_002394 [Linnemannia schmuckeri]